MPPVCPTAGVPQGASLVRETGEVVRAITGTVGQAERLLALAEKRYEYGVKTKLEVNDANFNLNQARFNLAQARRDYLVANLNLRYAMGTLGEVWTASYDTVETFTPAGVPGRGGARSSGRPAGAQPVAVAGGNFPGGGFI